MAMSLHRVTLSCPSHLSQLQFPINWGWTELSPQSFPDLTMCDSSWDEAVSSSSSLLDTHTHIQAHSHPHIHIHSQYTHTHNLTSSHSHVHTHIHSNTYTLLHNQMHIHPHTNSPFFSLSLSAPHCLPDVEPPDVSHSWAGGCLADLAAPLYPSAHSPTALPSQLGQHCPTTAMQTPLTELPVF